MRRLLLLFAGLTLVIWGRAILVHSDAAPPVVLRDGLLVVLIGVALFAWNGRHPAPAPRQTGASAPLPSLRLWAWLGFGGALVGGGWLAVAMTGDAANSGLRWPLLLWLAGLTMGVVALLWRRGQVTAETPGVWTVERARRFLQQREQRADQPIRRPLRLEERRVMLLLLALTILGLLLRLWNFAQLPASCMPAECDAGMSALNFLRMGGVRGLLLAPFPAFTLVNALALSVLGVSQNTLLVLGLLLGVAAIPLFYSAAARFVAPAGALLGTFLMVFSPLLIGLSRHPRPALLLSLFILAVLSLRPAAGLAGSERRWAGAALWAGLTLWAAPLPLVWLLFLWFVVTAPGRRSRWLAYFVPLLAAGLPRLIASFGQQAAWAFSLSTFFDQVAGQAAQLLIDRGYLPALLAALGAGYLVRHVRWRQGWLWSAGFLLTGLAPFAGSQGVDLPMLAPLIVLLGLSAVVALDQLVGEFARVWSPVCRPQRVLASAAAGLVLLLGIGGLHSLQVQAEQMDVSAQRDYTAIGADLYRRFTDSVDNGGSDDTLVLVPSSVLDSPATQWAARGVLPQAHHIAPLDPTIHLPFTGPPLIEQGMSDLVYIAPAADQVLQRYVTAIYPGAAAQPIQDGDGRTKALAYSVSRAAAANAQGLPALYYEGENVAVGQEVVDARREGPLDLRWDTDPPLTPPFTMTGQGALYIPGGGSYGLRIVSDPQVHARVEVGAPFSPQTILDTQEGRRELVVSLPQGLQALSITVQSGTPPGAFALQWQPPAGAWTPIPRQALYAGNPFLGNGWLASYYGGADKVASVQGVGDGAAGPLAAWRVEPWLPDGGLLAGSQEAVWQAKLAAPVEGSYIFALDADGPYRLAVDGVLLFDSSQAQARDASLLLSQGWHDLTLRYQPAGSGGIQLHWQPPGATAEQAVAPEFVLPLSAAASLADRPLPPLPAQGSQPSLAAAEPIRGPEVSPGLQAPAGNGPPSDLPALPFTLAWQVGSCGADIEQFQQPRGVALNLLNELVYVADQGNRRVIVRDLNDGGLVDFYSDERFEEPFDLDVNLLGHVFLLDAVAQTIYRIEEPQGTALAQPSATAFYRPRGLGMDLNGNFYVADTGGARIVKLAGVDGSVEDQIGGPDSLLGQGQPVDVMALPTGAVYAVTAQDGVLWRLDTGESWPATAPANTFDSPHLASLTTSAFFLTDPERRLVTYYSAAGAPLGQLRSDLFVKPVGIGALILDGDVLLAVSDSAACQLSLWRAPLEALPQ